jgi:DMSO/TMAO reductase YedYZ molybdopterin-dependent catalytic subunit
LVLARAFVILVGKRYKVDVASFYGRMEKLGSFRGVFSVAAVLLLIVLLVAIVYWQSIPQMLYPEEIREYEGQDLSSIGDFRENSIKGPQNVSESAYRLTITGLVNQSVEYTYADVINGFQKYQKVVTLHCVEGWSVKLLWEGFLLKDLLNKAEINPAAMVVIFDAYDGYSTSLPLNYILDNDILIAYKMNGVTLPPERGFPFQLVAESKYGYKWIKWITQIELSNNSDYLGYWESRGFPNDANLP